MQPEKVKPAGSGIGQLGDILGWAARHGLIRTHNDWPLDQIGMLRHEGDQLFIREFELSSLSFQLQLHYCGTDDMFTSDT